MKPRARWIPYLAIFIGLVFFSPFLFVVIFLPAYSSIALAIMFFLLSLISLFAGIKSRTTLTRAETSSVWWKNYLIILAVAQVSWGVLILAFSKFAKAHLNETVLTIIDIPALIIAFGFGIYAMVLLIRFIGSS